MWVITFFVVFSLPSQRDERYLLPAMPALAVLCALNWERISRRAFTASLVATGVAALLLAYLSLRLEQGVPGDRLYPPELLGAPRGDLIVALALASGARR